MESSNPWDAMPDNLWLAINIKAFWPLFQTLTAGELRAFIALALRADSENSCYPSGQRQAADAGRRSRLHSMRMYKRLESKHAIKIIRVSGGRNTYYIPESLRAIWEIRDGVFMLPGGDHKMDQGVYTKRIRGDHKEIQGGDHKEIQGGVYKTIPEPRTTNNIEHPYQQQKHAATLNDAVPQVTDRTALADLLMLNGVRQAKAIEIASDLDIKPETITGAIREAAAKQGTITNLGGWLVKSITSRAGKGKEQDNDGPKPRIVQ